MGLFRRRMKRFQRPRKDYPEDPFLAWYEIQCQAAMQHHLQRQALLASTPVVDLQNGAFSPVGGYSTYPVRQSDRAQYDVGIKIHFRQEEFLS